MTTNGLTECGMCGAESVEMVADPIEVEYRGEMFSVTGIRRERCSACGEEFFAPGQTNAILKAAADQARRQKGLLTPDEIRELRTSLGLRQTDLEEILGVGPKTVTRWEKGTVVQAVTADRLMRVLRQEPELVSRLLSAQSQPRSSESRPACGESFIKAEWLMPEFFTPAGFEVLGSESVSKPDEVDVEYSLAA